MIAGPTGVGKSALALDLARALGGEIISADSRQVYRGLEIGTAQPSAEEQALVPHHLVGCLTPEQPFSVGQFVAAADAALADIAAREGLALIVGGTYHYVQALLDRLDLPRVPPNWPLRAALEQLARERGPDTLHTRLAQLDPPAAATIPVANLRRVIRALEVAESTGQRFSEIGRRRGQPLPALRLALTMDRAALYRRLDERTEAMLSQGWLAEVRALVEAGYRLDRPALTSTGYRELIAHLVDKVPLDESVGRVKYSTHAYVRRQYAWLRRDPRLEWFEQGPELPEQVLRRARSYLANVTQSADAIGDGPTSDEPTRA